MLLTDAREFPAKVPRQACSSAESISLCIDVFRDSLRGMTLQLRPPVMPIIIVIIPLSALRRESHGTLLRGWEPYVWSWHLADIDFGAVNICFRG
jgi:hypothetical protein